jgi:hypothetical protein
MKLFSHLPILCSLILALGCTQNLSLPANHNASGNGCSDTLIVFKQTTHPGAQQSGMDGNAIYQKILNYYIFLLSPSGELKIDSLQAGEKKIRNFKVTLLASTPVYWKTLSEQITLVNKTNCPVLKIQFDYTTINQTSEIDENDISVYYSEKGLQKKLSAKGVKLLPQRITE